MAATAPVLSTVFKGGTGEQKAFSLGKLYLYILEEKLSQVTHSLPQKSLSGTPFYTHWLSLSAELWLPWRKEPQEEGA